MLATFKKRLCCAELVIYPTVVQGVTAPPKIIRAIELANQHDYVDIIVISRGGGSKEDLACFNDPRLAKSIYESQLPTVTGIGHEIDQSIADFVADKSFITPTATAEGITENRVQQIQHIYQKRCQLTDTLIQRLTTIVSKIDYYKTRADHLMQYNFSSHVQNLDYQHRNIQKVLYKAEVDLIQQLNNLEYRVSKYSPQSVLSNMEDRLAKNRELVEMIILNKIKEKHDKYSSYEHSVSQSNPRSIIMSYFDRLMKLRHMAEMVTSNRVKESQDRLVSYEQRFKTLNEFLIGGYALIFKEDQLIKSVKDFHQLSPDSIVLQYPDGEVTVKIDKSTNES